MGKRVVSHNRLIGLDPHPGKGAYQPAGPIYFFSMGVGKKAKLVFPGVQCHDHFFNGGIARPLSDAVYSPLHLPGAVHNGSQ